MTSLPPPPPPLSVASLESMPNNLGPTFLLAAGLVLLPLLVGLPLVLLGLAGIRDATGRPALPWLSGRLARPVARSRPGRAMPLAIDRAS